MNYDAQPAIEYRQPTPKTLVEAMVHGLDENCGWLLDGYVGPNGERIPPGAAAALEPYVRDYLAQKFATAMLKAQSPEEQARLEDLWFKITGKKMGEL